MNTESPIETSAAIAAKNDLFRRICLDVYYTSGVSDGVSDMVALSRAVESFNKFTGDNDPHGEHDFSSLIFEGQKIFWKIDYYDKDLLYWCDPLSSMCRRTLTIMLAEEY